MSEAARQVGDEQPVVGEPASHPHQAVVVGEPPVGMAPVLGEPVLLANGPKDQQPISPPSAADETSVNGVQTHSHLQSRAGSIESPPPSRESQYHSEEASNEEGTQRSDAHVGGNSIGSEVPASDAADAPVERVPATLDANHSIEEQHATDFPDVVEVSHVADVPPSLPLSEIPTENPFQALNDSSPTDDTITVETPDANAPSTQDETYSGGLGASDSNQLLEATALSATQKDVLTENLASTQTNLDDEPSGGTKVSEPVKEETHGLEPEHVCQAEAPVQDSDTSKAIPLKVETASTEVEHALTSQPDRDASVQENEINRGIPAVEQDLSRETPLSEVSTKHTPDSSQAQNNVEIPAEAPPVDSFVASQDTRAISSGECSIDGPPADKASCPRSVDGEDVFQHGVDGNPPLEKEQDLSKDDYENAEGKEKLGSSLKLPLIFTGLAIAAVGVVVTSISRRH